MSDAVSGRAAAFTSSDHRWRWLAPLLLVLAGCPGPHEGQPDLARDLGSVDLATPPDLAVCIPPQVERNPNAWVHVLPDEGLKPFADAINKAQRSVHVLIYLMGTGDVLDALKAKAMAGLEVKIILDQGQSANQKYATELQAAGAQILWSDPKFSYMHAKTLIVDDSAAVIATGNYSAYYNNEERNFAVDVKDPVDLHDLVALFEADWNRKEPDLGCTRLIVSPINSKGRLLALVNSAKKSLLIESMQFAELDIRAAVAARKAAGVDVRVLLADPSWISANTDAAAYLKQRNIPVRWLTDPNVHVKSIVVDADTAEAVAYAGSENLSFTSLTKNREIGVVLSEPGGVKTIQDTIEKDWAKATEF